MFDVRSFEAKNKVFKFNHQYMNKFEFVRCSKNDVRVRSMFDKMVFDPSLSNNYLKGLKVYLMKTILEEIFLGVFGHPLDKIANQV